MLGATADQLAKTTGFIKRQRQLTGAKLVRALTLGFLQNPATTLEELTQSGVLTEVEISPQGLDKRFTEEASTVLQPVLEEAVKTVVLAPQPVPIECLNRFTAVWLLDTTVLRLPDELAPIWPGTGGRTTNNLQSALKVEVGLELTRGPLKGPFLLPGRRANLAGQLPVATATAGSLRIADLGYFSLSLNGQARPRRPFLVESSAERYFDFLLLTENHGHSLNWLSLALKLKLTDGDWN